MAARGVGKHEATALRASWTPGKAEISFFLGGEGLIDGPARASGEGVRSRHRLQPGPDLGLMGPRSAGQGSARWLQHGCRAQSIAPAQERKLSKTLSYQLQVVNIDYLRDFHAQEAN